MKYKLPRCAAAFQWGDAHKAEGGQGFQSHRPGGGVPKLRGAVYIISACPPEPMETLPMLRVNQPGFPDFSFSCVIFPEGIKLQSLAGAA